MKGGTRQADRGVGQQRSVLAALSSGTGTGAGTWRLLQFAADATPGLPGPAGTALYPACATAYLYAGIRRSVLCASFHRRAALAGFSAAAAKFSGLEPCAGGSPPTVNLLIC